MRASLGGSERWFFIAGCQRSGTTLLRLILGSHPSVVCVDEPMSYRVLAGASTTPTAKYVGLKVPCIAEQLRSETLADRFVLPSIRNPYECQKIVFVVRDVRDTVSSMARLDAGGRSWLDRFVRPTLEFKKRDREFDDRYGSRLAEANVASNPSLFRAGLYWRYKVESCFEYRACGLPLCVVKYEDLVERPAECILNICMFLGIQFDEAMMQHHLMSHTEVDAEGMAIGGTDSRRPIDASSIARWRSGPVGFEEYAVRDAAGPAQAFFYPGSDDCSDVDEHGVPGTVAAQRR